MRDGIKHGGGYRTEVMRGQKRGGLLLEQMDAESLKAALFGIRSGRNT